jgi:hypothetical protein
VRVIGMARIPLTGLDANATASVYDGTDASKPVAKR